jgi:uncharacterized protein HemX
MNDAVTIAVSSAASLVVGILGKVLWDWIQSRGSEAKAVTSILLENISKNIEKIQERLEKNFDDIYERLRQAEIAIVKNCEQIEAMKSK